MSNSSNPGAGWSNGDLPPSMIPFTRDGKQYLYASHRRWIGLQESWTRIGDGHATDARHSTSAASGQESYTDAHDQALAVRSLIAQLCETFYRQHWATGTGGGVSIRCQHPTTGEWRVFVAPSGIQKEDMIGHDIFELDMKRNVVNPPTTPGLKQSACTPLWYVVYQHRPSAKCVIHTHSMHAQMATLLDPTETSSVLRITHLEMLKGVGGHAYDDILEIPMIDNRPTEDLLATQLERAIVDYPNCNAVLVRRHGVYVWGDSWEQAKTQCESFDYLFQSAVQMKQMGLDPGAMPKAGSYRLDDETELVVGMPTNKKQKLSENGFHGLAAATNKADLLSNTVPLLPRDAKILLLDIEGCTTSIAFVKDVLFPYVTANIEDYVLENEEELCSGLQRECLQANVLLPDHATGARSIVRFMVEQDIKSPLLKDLQGKMWKAGYKSGQLRGHVYSDFKPMLEWMKAKGIRIFIYSSGSIEAQKLLFGNSIVGDLLPFIEGHFDITTAGNKKEASSYRKIALTLSVDPGAIVFCSDAEAELVAAQEAGIGWPVMSIRPGNVPLTAVGKRFASIYSLLQLCGE